MLAVYKAEREKIGSTVEIGFYLESQVISFTLSYVAQVVMKYLSFIEV